jgi:hypothetical protein
MAGLAATQFCFVVTPLWGALKGGGQSRFSEIISAPSTRSTLWIFMLNS